MAEKLSKRLPAIIVVAIVVLGVGVVAWRLFAPEEAAPTAAVKLPQLSAAAMRGKVAFDGNCATCHGVNGAGSDKGPPLVHDIYNPGHHGDASFIRAIRQGVRGHHWRFGDMPPQPKVSDAAIGEIIQYVRELQRANGIVYRAHRM